MNKKGFTLVELLVVIAIIALLSTLSVVALNSARVKSRDARRSSDIKQIRTALELFHEHHTPGSKYPEGGAENGVLNLGTSSATCLDAEGWKSQAGCTNTPIFMQNVPQDPLDGRHYVYTRTPGDDNNEETYTIEYKLESASASSTATPSSMDKGAQSE